MFMVSRYIQALHYQSTDQPGLAAASSMTSKRAVVTMEACNGADGSRVPWHTERMLHALDGQIADVEKGDLYVDFVKKWGYDAEQRAHCATVLRDAFVL
jgi:hypothetical protein